MLLFPVNVSIPIQIWVVFELILTINQNNSTNRIQYTTNVLV